MADDHKRVIETWMLSTVQNDRMGDFDDIHIDKIDSGWAAREMWICAGIEAYHLTLDLRDQHMVAATVSVAFSLEPGDSARGVDFAEGAELSARLGWSPPSLYLFSKGKEPWTPGELRRKDDDGYPKVSMRILDAAQLFGSEVRGVAYFIEFLQSASDDWKRTVFLAG
jgi:hypothetical protein